MRINKFLAQATGLSRRAADTAIAGGQVSVNGQAATPGHDVGAQDIILYDGRQLRLADIESAGHSTVMLNKPAGYVVSRNGQGSRTIYDLLPAQYHNLKPVGRLDKDSSGLLLLTDDGELANQLTHPRYRKTKLYEVALDQPLQPLHRQMISDHGLQLEDGPSRLQLERLHDGDERQWLVTMHEGRNRQIRRTFTALGYTVTRLHRTQFGQYALGSLAAADYKLL
jgi:23S rRNA pseudouridine2605 synthase